jgi:hypothetical protein
MQSYGEVSSSRVQDYTSTHSQWLEDPRHLQLHEMWLFTRILSSNLAEFKHSSLCICMAKKPQGSHLTVGKGPWLELSVGLQLRMSFGIQKFEPHSTSSGNNPIFSHGMAVQNPSHHLEVQDTKQVLLSAICGQCLRMVTLLTKASAMNGMNQTNNLFLNLMILLLKPI